ncbi:citrate synthase [Pseudofrankia inefficax]|uniref:citrate synthase (unknown stereospecificity) n=1 Tax=Pseudofrankia inefficax (strain DSM 45817 / CECT 9037 / DDB 130130 / EuI1c) TaxID=298654 RepID=E3JBM3_PSEI1|nr:citrate synthase [Pseudofrankia inefficax]ADP81043.1 Citrate synthase [Pseudofrankia inefficax]
MADEARLTTQEVAELLGVKTQTVYAYASRGLLTSEPAPDGRGSTFDAREVDALAARRGRARPRPAEAFDDTFPMRSGITLSEGGRLYYRGRDAVQLAESQGFEAAVAWLWEVGSGAGSDGRPVVGPSSGELPAVELRAPEELVAAVRRTTETLPAQARLNDRLRVAVAVAASADPLRFDLRRQNVLAMGAGLIAVLVDALPPASETQPAGPANGPATGSVAERLWPKLTPVPATPGAVACLDQALVLLADHGLAASTLAARVAASARASPYAVVSAGLGPLDGPLHGAASGLAHRMLAEVVASGNAIGVISEYLRSGRPIPGLGMRLYPDGDPRARALLASLRGLPGAAEILDAAASVVRAASGRALTPVPATRAETHANIDLALAALTLHAGMPAEAGEVIFAVARTAGWIAHALEEYAEPALRLRPRGTYTGPRPA